MVVVFMTEAENNAAAVPVPLRPDEIPQDLICTICIGFPTEPAVTTPCEHVFCKPCILQALSSQSSSSNSSQNHQAKSCPVYRTAISSEAPGIRAFRDGSLLGRIWGNIPVKCAQHDKGCVWNGPISNYEYHEQEQCVQTRQRRQERARQAQQEQSDHAAIVAQLQEENRRLLQTNAELREKERAIKLRMNDALAACQLLQETLMNHNNWQGPDAEPLWTGSYNCFGRHSVVKLSRLISQYLENKPIEIDANRIYSCVEACYRALAKDSSDNPPHYYINMRMLLSTCYASTWFSPNQQNRILKWISESGWA